jgi:hypothetical protein
MSNIMKVTFDTPNGKSVVHYGPFDDMEYLEFERLLPRLVNPNWKHEIEHIRLNTHFTEIVRKKIGAVNAN